jgi:hypothetical protein
MVCKIHFIMSRHFVLSDWIAFLISPSIIFPSFIRFSIDFHFKKWCTEFLCNSFSPHISVSLCLAWKLYGEWDMPVAWGNNHLWDTYQIKSLEHSPSSEVNSRSAGQEITRLYVCWMFITVFSRNYNSPCTERDEIRIYWEPNYFIKKLEANWIRGMLASVQLESFVVSFSRYLCVKFKCLTLVGNDR